MSADMEEPREIPRFEIVSDCCSDHHFAAENPPPKLSASFHNRMNREWKILSANLPSTITVRTYEGRIDLMRAAIVGSSGTPYHDGLFFFDIMFPPDYPSSPPKVHYWAFGERINPNLYGSGMVCLSLLNTWMGARSECWNYSKSTILQVLLSIQALVLNEDPLFNEPGYRNSGCAGDLKKSTSYNEVVFVASCKTMIHLMTKPLQGFETLIKDHFKERCEAILRACDEYIHGLTQVGRYGSGGNTRAVLLPSTKFKSGLLCLCPGLARGFKMCGVDGKRVKRRLKKHKKKRRKKMKKEEEKRKKEEEERKKKAGLMERVWTMCMDFFNGKGQGVTAA